MQGNTGQYVAMREGVVCWLNKKTLQKEKKRKARIAKKAKEKKPSEIKMNEKIKKALDSLREVYQSGALTKAQYEALRDELRKRKK